VQQFDRACVPSLWTAARDGFVVVKEEVPERFRSRRRAQPTTAALVRLHVHSTTVVAVGRQILERDHEVGSASRSPKPTRARALFPRGADPRAGATWSSGHPGADGKAHAASSLADPHSVRPVLVLLARGAELERAGLVVLDGGLDLHPCGRLGGSDAGGGFGTAHAFVGWGLMGRAGLEPVTDGVMRNWNP
jgi:hypothetical protein